MNSLKLGITLLLSLIILGSPVSDAFSVDKPKQGSHRFYQGIPLAPTRIMRLRLNHIYAFDERPLDQRTPVVLVPGRAEEYQYAVWWERFRKYAQRDKKFSHHYKLYLFLYNSKETLSVQSNHLVSELTDFSKTLPRNIKIQLVSYSLGGVIANEALQDDLVFNAIDTHYAIGVPFHGSPFFTPNWFRTHYRPSNHSPIRWFWDHALYHTYMFNKSNLVKSLSWDGFDGSGPQPRTAWVENNNAEQRIKSKTVVYGSYLANPYLNEKEKISPLKLKKIITAPLRVPRKVVGLVLPDYITSVHQVFEHMNMVLANVPAFDLPEEKDTGVYDHPYRYNDGVIPLSSALYLPSQPTPYTGNLNEMLEQLDVKSARIFPNMDHMDYAEFKHYGAKFIRPDILHLEDGKRSPYEWILYDLNKHQEKTSPNGEV